MDLLRKDPDHYFMVQGPEAVGDVALDEPRGPGPRSLHVPQRGVAASPESEPVRMVGERRLVVCFQEKADYLADELVRPGRQSQRAQFPVLFRDVDPPDRTEAAETVSAAAR